MKNNLAITNKNVNQTFFHLNKYTARLFICISLLFVQSFVSNTITAQSNNSKPPNILVILLDDARYDMFAPNGGPDFFSTPAINRIAEEGINFKYTGVTTSLCVPSRSSIYTGLYSHHHGAIDNYHSPKKGLTYVSSLLQNAGYYTGFVGKWLLSDILPDTPIGFNYWAISNVASHLSPSITFNDGTTAKYQGHDAVIFTNFAIDFLTNKVPSGKPWMLFLFHRVPHTPLQALTGEDTLYQHVPITFPDNFASYKKNFPSYLYPAHQYSGDSAYLDQYIRDYYETCQAAEYSVDSVLSYLEANHILDSTLIIFSSDNGFFLGEHDLKEKQLSYDVSLRVPLFIRYPKWFEAGTVVDNEFAANIDFAPTLLEAAGVPNTYRMDGISLHQLAMGQVHRKDFFFEFYPADDYCWEAIRSLSYEYIYSYCSSSTEEFFDLISDPEENNNLIFDPSYASVIQQFRVKRDSFRLSTNDTLQPLPGNCKMQSVYYQDADGDGYGNPDISKKSTTAPSGYVLMSGDCNDNNASQHPGVLEICNSIDDNCNGQIDEGVKSTFYSDADNDGYGNPSFFTVACNAPTGYVSNDLDCNDANLSIHPGAAENCNGIDDNCNWETDEGVKFIYYADADADGYGNANNSTSACSVPNGYVLNSSDCNDANARINPNSTEVMNGIDDDCDGLTDEKSTFYADQDHDGFGNPDVSTEGDSVLNGYVADHTDCDDLNANIHPGASEACNGIDDNCNSQVDEGVKSSYYEDSDGDGYGKSTVIMQACAAPSGYVVNNTDCNDANGNIHPGAADACNGIDDNCNGIVDENTIAATISPAGTVTTCSGVSITLTANSGTGISYQWLKNNKNISGATNQTYSTKTAAGYQVKETNTFNCSGTSATTSLNLASLPTATITPLGNLNICQTNSVVLQANSGTGLRYQWVKGNADISGATGQNYTATKTATYKVMVTNSSNCSKTSAGVKVTKTCREHSMFLPNSFVLSIFPNPANNKFTVKFNLPEDLLKANGDYTLATLEIRNILGQIIYAEDFSINETEVVKKITLNSGEGMYMVSVLINNRIYSAQVIIAN
ncbi:MAG: sulfatase-like hydrolase/transferase [Chitinophagales bacterium]|nr:sulfatase-like hydrolase/transferase [Chitinophagales bacterium]